MAAKKKIVKYPDNLYLAVEVFKSEKTHQEIADAIGVTRQIVNLTINGHYRGLNIIPKILAELNLTQTK